MHPLINSRRSAADSATRAVSSAYIKLFMFTPLTTTYFISSTSSTVPGAPNLNNALLTGRDKSYGGPILKIHELICS